MNGELRRWGDLLDGAKAERDRVLAEKKQAEEEVNRVKAELADAEEALRFVVGLYEKVRMETHGRVERMVNGCLKVVFDNPYEMRLDFVGGKRAEVGTVFKRGSIELDDPLNEVGGGVVDVAAFGMRLACVLLAGKGKRRLLILDEPWKNIRGELYKNRTREVLLKLADEVGFQFLLNTDVEEYGAGKVVVLGGQKNGDGEGSVG